jgi:site-specific DNA recombinase
MIVFRCVVFYNVLQCGRLLTASSSKGRKIYYHYYHCTTECGVRYKTDVVETSFEKELARWKPHMAVQQLYRLLLQDMYEREQGLRRKELLADKEEIERQNKRKLEARKLRLSNDLDTDDYRAIKKECEAGIAM